MYYHILFHTKGKYANYDSLDSNRYLQFICGNNKNKKFKTLSIYGVEGPNIHLLVDIHPSIAVGLH